MAAKCDAESSEVFSNAEFYHLRNCLVELLEEVKLRRNNDTESEERIKLLVNEKYELERKYEGEQGKTTALEEQHQRHLVDMERNFQEKMRLIEEENKQLKIYRKCGEKETDALKDSVRSLQLAKYSLEKNLRDQEHKLQSHLSSSDQQLSEISALEQKLQSMTSHFQQLSSSQDRLTKNVNEAVKLNRSLMYVNEHQKCVMEQQKADLHQCQQRLVQLSTKLDNQPTSTVDVEELRQQQAALQHQLKIMVEQKETHDKELDDYKTRHMKTLDELQETYSLVNQHLNNANQHRVRSKELENIIETLKSKVRTTEELIDKLHQELDVEKTLKSEALAEWTKQEETLRIDLEDVKRELSATEQARAVLEELNMQLTESNVKLAQQYDEAKAILDIDKTSVEQQTSISHFNTMSCDTQTETDMADISVQTVTDTTNTGVQATKDTYCSCVQTEHPQHVSSMSQTFVPSLTNCSAQTILLETVDKEIQVEKFEDFELRDTCVSGDVSLKSDVARLGIDISPQKQMNHSLEDNQAQNEEKEIIDLCAPECGGSENASAHSSDDSKPDISLASEDTSLNEGEVLNVTQQGQLEESKLCQKVLSSSTNAASVATIALVSDAINPSSQPQEESVRFSSTTSSAVIPRVQQKQISTPARAELPIAKHLNHQSTGGANTQSKIPKQSHPEFFKMGPNEPKISPASKFTKSRALYSENQLLWGAPAVTEEPQDWCKKSIVSPKDTSHFVSVSETWKALISAEEQKKKPSTTSGRSPRSKLKMGLRVLAETSPVQSHKLVKPVISGLEETRISSVHRHKLSRIDQLRSYLDDAEEKSPNPRTTKSVFNLHTQDSPKTQRPLRLQRSSRSFSDIPTVNPSATFESTYNAALRFAVVTNTCAVQEPEQSKSKTKGILKAPGPSPKSNKSVRFSSVLTAHSQVSNFQATTLPEIVPGNRITETLDQIQASKPSGEVLLFSDEDEDQTRQGAPQGDTTDQASVVGLAKRRKLTTSDDG